MKKGILLLLLVSMLASIVIGCGNEDAKKDAEKIKEKIEEVVGNEKKEEVDDETAVKEVVTNFVKAFADGTTHENITGLEGYEYFTPEYRQKMIDTDDSAEWVESVKENKAVIRLGEILFHNYTAPSTDHPDIASVSLSYKLYWTSESEEEEVSGWYNCSMGLFKTDGVWQIASITYVTEEDLEEVEE